MNVLGKNITDLARKRQLSIPKLASRAGVDKGNLSRIIKTGEGYSSASLGRLAEALDVSVDQLFSAERNVVLLPGVRKVPLLTPQTAIDFCRNGMGTQDADMHEFVLTSTRYSERTFGMTVTGESMLPDFLPGDVVNVDPECPLEPGRYVVAANGGKEAILRRYAERGTGEDGVPIFELIPSNPHYASVRSDRHKIEILGVVRERIIRLV